MLLWRIFRMLAIVIVLAMGIIVILYMLLPILDAQIRNTHLADEQVAFAFTLLNRPRTVFVDSENFSIEFRQPSEANPAHFCVEIMFDRLTPPGIKDQYEPSRLIVNEAWVINARKFGGINLHNYHKIWCVGDKLEPGVHLVEFELRNSIFGKPIHIQQWAIEIE